MLDTKTGLPADYAELFEHYFPMVRSVVAKAGIAQVDVEDVSMELVAKFIERDVISWYDPTKLFDVGANPKTPGARIRPAKFGALLKRFCQLYVRQHIDKQVAKARREPHRLEDACGTVTWGEANAEFVAEVGNLGSIPGIARRGPEEIVCTESPEVLLARAVHELTEAAETHARAAREAVSGHERVHASRREAETRRAAQALSTAAELASGRVHACEGAHLVHPEGRCRCERVSAVSVAKVCGMSSTAASTALRTGRAQLRAQLEDTSYRAVAVSA